jgi:ABC-2 type transport system ATP-binding protein
MNPIVETEHLAFAYHLRRDVLRDINLQVSPGSFYALLGRNGAGKSTLLKILAGALVPRQGSSRTLGADSLRLGVEEWQSIGFLSEAQPLYNGLTGAELLRFTRQFYPNWDTGFCDHLCRTMELPLERKVGRYSKGERMKFLLLLAMSFHPRLLLLDEPFSGLDVVAKEQLISSLLEATGQEQWAVLCASHDLAEVERLADTVGIIKSGSLTLSEPLESIQARYRRVQVFGSPPSAAAQLDPTMLQPSQSENGLCFVEPAFSEDRERELRTRFGPRVEFSSMPLREILLSVFTSPEGRS